MHRSDHDSARDSRMGKDIRELLSLPARHLGQLPIETRIVVHHPGFKQDIVLLTGESRGASLELMFRGAELRALAEGVESGRLWSWDFVGFCLMKQHDPAFHVTREIALAGAQWVEEGPAWPTSRVLERLGVAVVAVELAWSSEPTPVPGVRAA